MSNCVAHDITVKESAIVSAFSGNMIQITDCVADTIIANPTDYFGGIICYGNEQTNTILTNCIASNIAVETDGASCIGGLMATGSATLGNCKSINNSFEVNNITNGVGGIIGAVSRVNIDSCLVNSLKIQGNNVYSMGGIAGGLTIATIKNNTLNAININCIGGNSDGYNEGETVGSVGGIAGHVGYSTEIDGNTVKNASLKITVDAENQSIGGIVGRSYDNTTLSNCEVIDSSIEITKKSSISETLGANYAGGIAGYGISATDCDVTGTVIISTGFIQDGVGGIIGNAGDIEEKSEVANCDVIDCTIEGHNGVGGIVGIAANKITNCRVIETKVTGNGSNIGGIQGDGGETEVARILSNCSLMRCSIKGNASYDYYQGRTSFNETSDNTDTITCTHDTETTLGPVM